MHVTFAPSASAGSAQVLNELTLARVRALPGVQAAGAIHELFSAAVVDNFGLRSIEGRAPESRRQWTPLAWTTIRGDYFQAMGTRLLSGRFFSVSDTADSPLVAVINEAVARRYWPGENAIGKRFKGFDRRGKNDDWLTVIGVVEDMHSNGLDRQPAGQIYQWYRQNQESTPDLVVRARGNPSAVAGALRKTVRSVDAAAVSSKVSTVEQQLAGQLSSRRFEAFLVTLFSALALLLAGTGVYGIIQYGVSRRISEIGIRMALGAMPADIQRLVISEGLSVGIIGMALGAAGALVLTRFLSSLLFGVRPSDPLTFTGASVLLFSVAALASSMPARRASRIDPMVALRYE
jgi:predicted permease